MLLCVRYHVCMLLCVYVIRCALSCVYVIMCALSYVFYFVLCYYVCVIMCVWYYAYVIMYVSYTCTCSMYSRGSRFSAMYVTAQNWSRQLGGKILLIHGVLSSPQNGKAETWRQSWWRGQPVKIPIDHWGVRDPIEMYKNLTCIDVKSFNEFHATDPWLPFWRDIVNLGPATSRDLEGHSPPCCYCVQ